MNASEVQIGSSVVAFRDNDGQRIVGIPIEQNDDGTVEIGNPFLPWTYTVQPERLELVDEPLTGETP